MLNHLTQVSMPRGSSTQTRTFKYASGAYVGAFLLSATNPENGTVTYSYYPLNGSNGGQLLLKTDAKGQQLRYAYDSYNRLATVTWFNKPGGAQVLRTYSYDSGQYGLGRLTGVQYAPQTGQITLADSYSYTQGGLVSAKCLGITELVTFGSGYNNAAGSVCASYAYNNEGKPTSVTYPTTNPGGVSTPGAVYNYSYDSMSRLSGMTDSSSNSMVTGVSYGASNELLGMSYRSTPLASFNAESRTYNMLGQLMTLVNSNSSMSYTYPIGNNNGKIAAQTDYVSGEQVVYTYDSLNRLISAVTTAQSDQVATPWGQGFSYDGFGNLTAKTVLKGSAPTFSAYVDPATNRVSGTTYDANGNPSANVFYDVENRLTNPYPGSATYGYDAQNKRNYISGSYDGYGNMTAYTVVLYSPGGQKLGTYRIDVGTVLYSTQVASDLYFGGRRLGTMDRLGSVGKFYPYGEAKGGTNPADTWSFATYWRDSNSNLDYADQRYYASPSGRFLTPDPYKAGNGSGDSRDPQSWNRYAYAQGDPVNFIDPRGLFICNPAVCGNGGDDGGGDGGGGASFGSGEGGHTNPDLEGQLDRMAQERARRANTKRTAQHLSDAIGAAMKALLNPDCAGLFGLADGTPDPATLLADLQSGTSGYGYFDLDFLPLPSTPGFIANAVTRPTFAYGFVNGVLMNQGINGAYITINIDPGAPFNFGYSTNDRAVTVLHELGHVYDYIWGNNASKIVNDQDDPTLSKQNTDLVNQNCFK